MYKKVLMGLLLILGVSASAQDLSQSQKELAEKIYFTAKTAPNKYGDTFEKTLIMISMQESFLGEVLVGDWKKGKPLNSGSFGYFHFRINTVRHLQSLYPDEIGWISSKSDDWVIDKLLHDDEFNIVLAILNTLRLSEAKLTQRSKFKLISQWNGGINNPSYVNAVNKHKDIVSNLVDDFKGAKLYGSAN